MKEERNKNPKSQASTRNSNEEKLPIFDNNNTTGKI